MEENIKRLRIMRQEMITYLNGGLPFGNTNVKDPSKILDEMDFILDEMENRLTLPDKEL